MRFTIETIGNWRKMMDQEADALSEANHRATMRRGDAIKNAVRANVKQSGIRRASAIANTWRGQGFPRSPKAHADRPAYVLGNKFLRVIEQLESGQEITFRGFGVIPIGIGLRVARQLKPGTPRTEWLREVRQALGVDRLISQKAKRSPQILLGAFVTGANGKTRFQAVGVVVKRVRGRKLLDHTRIIEREGANFGEQVANEAWPIFQAAAERIQNGPAAREQRGRLTVGG